VRLWFVSRVRRSALLLFAQVNFMPFSLKVCRLAVPFLFGEIGRPCLLHSLTRSFDGTRLAANRLSCTGISVFFLLVISEVDNCLFCKFSSPSPTSSVIDQCLGYFHSAKWTLAFVEAAGFHNSSWNLRFFELHSILIYETLLKECYPFMFC